MKKIIYILFTLAIISSCTKDNNEYSCEAIVLENDYESIITCDKPMVYLKITKGLDFVYSIVPENYDLSDSVLIGLNLSNEFDTPGLEIKLNMRAVQNNEYPSCYNFEMPVMLGEPVIYVLRAEAK